MPSSTTNLCENVRDPLSPTTSPPTIVTSTIEASEPIAPTRIRTEAPDRIETDGDVYPLVSAVMSEVGHTPPVPSPLSPATSTDVSPGELMRRSRRKSTPKKASARVAVPMSKRCVQKGHPGFTGVDIIRHLLSIIL